MRLATSLLVTAGLVASLAACSAPDSDTEDTVVASCDATPSGAASDSVEVTGDLGAEPTVTFDIPLEADQTQRSVVIEGKGATATTGDTVDVQFTIYSGTTSAAISGTDYTEASQGSLPIDPTTGIPGIVQTLDCSQAGSRIVGVIPPADAFGDQGNEQLGVQPGETIVVVLDIIAIQPPATPPLDRVDGEDQPATPGFPAVVLAEDGRPTVTIPADPPPAELLIALLKKGDGAEVASGDDVVVQYQGINWNTGVIFDESWARGAPATFNTNAVIPGFTAALVGQTVGSQVIVIIPPESGYGAAGSPPDIGGTDTIVFVIDILGIA